MPNIVECPAEGCNSRVMLDDNFTEGVCTVCQFHFCAKCHQAFHPDTACVAGPLANLTPDEGISICLHFFYLLFSFSSRFS